MCRASARKRYRELLGNPRKQRRRRAAFWVDVEAGVSKKGERPRALSVPAARRRRSAVSGLFPVTFVTNYGKRALHSIIGYWMLMD